MSKQIVLTAVHGELTGQQFVFEGPKQALIGRSPSCALRLLGDVTVSRQHCQLDVNGPDASVQDLGSLNGTYLNGENIGRHGVRNVMLAETMRLPVARPLRDGDELRLGQHMFR